MSSDWIKIRTDLYRDPKVCMVADELLDLEGDLANYVDQNCRRPMAVTRNVMRNATVGSLVTVWGVIRHRGKREEDNLFLRGCTLSVIDDIADMPGFGEAMALVGWVTKCPKGLLFPNFFKKFNVDPADEARRKNAERQRRYRQKKAESGNATVTLRRNKKVTQEKRREEKSNNNPPIVPQGTVGESPKTTKKTSAKNQPLSEKFKHLQPEVTTALGDFIEHRKKLKKPMTDKAIEILVAKILKITNHPPQQVELLETAIERGWQTVYEPKDGFETGSRIEHKPGERDEFGFLDFGEAQQA